MRLVRRVFGYVMRRARFWLSYDWIELVCGGVECVQLRRLSAAPPVVMIIEPNRYHGEVLPGLVGHFQSLGLDVLLIVRRAVKRSGVFCRWPSSRRPLMYAMPPWMMRRILGGRSTPRVQYVLLASAYWAEAHGHFGLFSSYLGPAFVSRFRYATLVHEFDHVKADIDTGRLSPSCIALLRRFQYRGFQYPALSASNFGVVQSGPHRGGAATFVAVGAIVGEPEVLRELVAAVASVAMETDVAFRVILVGRLGTSVRTLIQSRSEISFLGAVSFPQLFNLLEAARFILPLLDTRLPEHRRYLDGKTSGSRQLALGFGLIPVMEAAFAEAYGFHGDAAVAYPAGMLRDALRDAVTMGDSEYAKRMKALSTIRSQVDAESLETLRRFLALPRES